MKQYSYFKKALLGATLFAGLIALAMPANAQRVQPMAYDLGPSGSKSSTSLRIENTSQTDMTIELSASKISIDAMGIETRTPADDDFLIFPPQTILKGGKTQAIRVKYIGDPTIDKANPYRISIKQIPIDLSGEGKSAIGMVVNFHTLANVSPDKAVAKLNVDAIKPGAGGGWDVTVSNKGNNLGRISKTVWTFTDGGKSKILDKDEVGDLTDTSLILPGSTVSMTIKAPEGFSPHTSSVKIDVR